MLKTVDEACDFIADWCGEKGDYGGQPLSRWVVVPDCVRRLNARIGDLWHSAKPVPGAVLRYATPFLGLLGGQDEILNPNDYRRDKKGVVTLVCENQGVWHYGFKPANVDQLLVGDWDEGRGGNLEIKWRRIAATPEDALVCTLLHNFCAQSDAKYLENGFRPGAEHLVLWQHPA